MLSSSKSFEWIPMTETDLLSKVGIRSGETKIGQEMQVFEKQDEAKIQFVVLGICEDLGPQTNGGFPGAKKAFEAFISYFVNVQSNEFLKGESILMLGNIETRVEYQNREQGISLIEELDEFVEVVLAPFIAQKFIPIVIGGGHNNAFPLIKSISQSHGKPIQVVNLDPHADFRALEGRHSGNPFSYAFHQNWMRHYAVMGLHQSYNSQHLLDELKSNKFTFTFWDDYISGKSDFKQDLNRVAAEIHTDHFGLELDMDSIAYMPASAFTPSGVTIELARKYILTMAKSKWVSYLHLPEAAPKNDVEFIQVGKAITYLVTDFIKARKSVNDLQSV